ncbi:hypothetical protein DSO57_1002246 [Entomophthora muscae]|uniref:Uncharacterized protein n=1 Tax=Entomophthora muscae TaxID=34485 RepID=A0ACC2SY24_9FUNG|nr:hypothetical protein DSO57_1002246 [Entomophthora muscae]
MWCPQVLQGGLPHSYLHSLVAHRPDSNGFERLLPPVVPGVLPVVPSLSSHPSCALDGILVVCCTRMGAKLTRKQLFSCAGLLAVPIHSPPFGKSFCLCLPASGGNSPASHYIKTSNPLLQLLRQQGKLWSKVPDKPPLVTTPSLDQWRAKAQEIKHKQISGGAKHLKARYAVGDPIYTLNPNSAKLEPNHLGPFKIAAVYDNHTYQLKDAQGNTKKLHHDCLRPCRPSPHKGCLCRPSQTFCRLWSWCLTTSRGQGGCCNRAS